jgi:hypothetical protein
MARGQLSSTQLSKLFWSRMQLKFCRNHRFPTLYCSKSSTECQENESI